MLISQLKCEIFELTQKDKDFQALVKQKNGVNNKYAQVDEEKFIMEDDFNKRHDENMTTLLGLRKEIENHRFFVNDKERQNAECQAEINKTYEAINRIESEIFTIKRDISDKQQEGLIIRSQMEGAQMELNKQREERHRD